MKNLIYLLAFILVWSCTTNTDVPIQNTMKKPPPMHQKATQEPSPLWLFVGDSLTAGYGVAPNESFVEHVKVDLKKQGIVVKGAGVSGDTSAGVLRRIDWLMQQNPTRVFLTIGANDGLRGQPTQQLQKNLMSIIDKIKAKGADVTLIGMKLPPNYGAEYTQSFADTYQQVAHTKGVSFLPFLLEKVAGHKALNLADGIHPNAQGHQQVALHVLSFIKKEGLLNNLPK